MTTATCEVPIGDRLVTVSFNAAQLAVRHEGELVTAEIVSIAAQTAEQLESRTKSPIRNRTGGGHGEEPSTQKTDGRG